MILEQNPIQIKNLQVKKSGEDFILTEAGVAGGPSLKLSPTQHQYYDLLKSGKSIYQIVQSYLGQSRLVSFIEIYDLLENLSKHRWVTGHAADHFSTLSPAKNTALEKLNSQGKTLGEAFKKIEKSLAFMRFMGADLKKIFSQQAKVTTALPKTLICRTGETNRDLYVIIDGHAGVYRTLPTGQPQLIGTLGPGSVFGERSFFMNVPRTADVITLAQTQIAVFPYTNEIGQQLNPQTSAELVLRLRAIQGILSSPIFLQLPSESIESLAFAGKLFAVEPGQSIIREGESGKSFFVIVDGAFNVTQGGKIIRNIGDGGVLGEIALLVSGGARTATVTAQRKSTILEITLNEFYNLLGQNLLLAKEIETIAWQRWQSDQVKK